MRKIEGERREKIICAIGRMDGERLEKPYIFRGD
jgi:hypothetical protein